MEIFIHKINQPNKFLPVMLLKYYRIKIGIKRKYQIDKTEVGDS